MNERAPGGLFVGVSNVFLQRTYFCGLCEGLWPESRTQEYFRGGRSGSLKFSPLGCLVFILGTLAHNKVVFSKGQM